jgi:hypothetical protein
VAEEPFFVSTDFHQPVERFSESADVKEIPGRRSDKDVAG